jgi:hypothetical protein
MNEQDAPLREALGAAVRLLRDAAQFIEGLALGNNPRSDSLDEWMRRRPSLVVVLVMFSKSI